MFRLFHQKPEEIGGRQSLIPALIIIAVALICSQFLPKDPAKLGFLVCIPAIFLIVYIFITKRIIEALTLASGIGFIMGSGANVLTNFSGVLLDTLMSEDIAWLIIVCGLMGSIIALIEKAGGSFAFGNWIAKHSKTKKSSLLWTWVLGIAVFIDDYLNSLTVATCMSPLTDKHKVSREMLSYVVDSTAAPLCVLIPISTWAVFCARILESNIPGLENGLLFFISTIPYNFYGWIAALIVPLVILGYIPLIGPMKRAEQRVQDGGPLAPEGSEKIDIRGGKTNVEFHKTPKIINFFAPIGILIGATIFFDTDMQMGVLFTLAFMFIFFLAQNLMSADEYTDVAIKGFQNMMLPIVLMVLAFVFAAMNEQIGFTQYVINAVLPIMKQNPELMPFFIFLILSVTEFITGTNWGMYIIALPICIPLAIGIDANLTLVVASVLSAGVFGSHICFYSDATVISSAAAGCNNFDHAASQAPYGFIAAGISAILFLIAGFVF